MTAASPGLATAATLATRFATILKDHDATKLDEWLTIAADSEFGVLAKDFARDLSAVRAAITEQWSTSPVEGQINRLKTIKRQMYGRAGYQLLRNRVLAAT